MSREIPDEIINSFIKDATFDQPSPVRKIFHLLSSRGFLLDIIDGYIYISNNSHGDDYKFLDVLITNCEIGQLEMSKKEEYKYKIILNDIQSENNWKEIFRFSGGVASGEYCNEGPTWQGFIGREHGHKLAVRYLDPFIGRLVKAVSSIGFVTSASCHGRELEIPDPDEDTIQKATKHEPLEINPIDISPYIILDSKYHATWFKVLLNDFIKSNIELKCNWHFEKEYECDYYLYINNEENNLLEQYIEILHVANLLYSNRFELRGIRKNVIEEIDKKNIEIESLNQDELYEIFKEQFKKIFPLYLPVQNNFNKADYQHFKKRNYLVPFKSYELNDNMPTNIIYCGDCMGILFDNVGDESIDLIYVDPPFGVELKQFGFEDNGVSEKYTTWMESIIQECHRALKRTGSLYIHCDGCNNHKMRNLMDEIFGSNNFRNEIIWAPKRVSGIQPPKNFAKAHFTILWYSKSDDYTYNKQYVPFSEEEISRYFNQSDDKGRYSVLPLHGHISDERIRKFEEEGVLIRRENDRLCVKKYLNDLKGHLVYDLWDDIYLVHKISKEKVNWLTQQPVALLERIIKASSNPGDIILDPMCGSGTTLVAAEKLKRKWIGIDIEEQSCKLSVNGLRDLNINISENDIVNVD